VAVLSGIATFFTKNYYAGCGVPRGADLAAIKAAYRRLALLKHPDRNGNTPESTAAFHLVSSS